MPAVLTENLFASNPEEAQLSKDPSVIEGLAKAHAVGIAKGAKLESKPVSASSQVTPGRYRVYTRVFTTLEEAEKARDKIAKSVGFNPVVRKEE